jgi:hypothetical protein
MFLRPNPEAEQMKLRLIALLIITSAGIVMRLFWPKTTPALVLPACEGIWKPPISLERS